MSNQTWQLPINVNRFHRLSPDASRPGFLLFPLNRPHCHVENRQQKSNFSTLTVVFSISNEFTKIPATLYNGQLWRHFGKQQSSLSAIPKTIQTTTWNRFGCTIYFCQAACCLCWKTWYYWTNWRNPTHCCRNLTRRCYHLKYERGFARAKLAHTKKRKKTLMYDKSVEKAAATKGYQQQLGGLVLTLWHLKKNTSYLLWSSVVKLPIH